MLLGLLVFLVTTLVAYVAGHVLGLRRRNTKHRTQLFSELGLEESSSKRIVGFFHPYCNAGGGGERVLWAAIHSIQQNEPDIVSVVYSGDVDATKDVIISKVKARFDIELSPKSLHFVFLESRRLVEDSTWPRFTLLGQSLGSMFLAWEAMSCLIPDLFIDTMGYAFTFPVVSLLGNIPVGAYTHYPTISTTMLSRVKARSAGHTNSEAISSSVILSNGKLLYYRIFMYYYAYSLRQARFIMVNSTWTKDHVDSILNHIPFTPTIGVPKATQVVYPSCDTQQMAAFPFEGRERMVLSIAQFRPEKDHPVQLRSLHSLLGQHPEYRGEGPSAAKLVMVGGSRNAGDAARVESLRALAKELGIEDQVQFVVNAPFPEMLSLLSRASVGLNTMVEEHFGINVVEFMAAGAIPVAHASGGPLLDIVVPYNGERTGFHANSPESFAEAFHTVFTLPPEADLAMRHRARTWAVQKFSEAEFEKGWNASGWRKWL
ncbi:mannosyltransferase [Epithele typhae]|uniref:mannosyltransferase n=1 Tax=Epithele typhae TaxID=378194 RepID=UPI0020072705|nr:mannosyltransferase [Epithele typhae]KAH9932777.1 mannosyltransferase [Epithele typhae]